jgi:hypothetical protein
LSDFFQTSGNELDKVFDKGIDCHTMFLPAIDHEHLEDLSKTPLSDLTPGLISSYFRDFSEYRRDLISLRDKILNKLNSKTTTRGPINGATLSSLIRYSPISPISQIIRFLVLSANENRIPQLPSLWQSWINQQSETAIQDALSGYRREMGHV